MELMKFSLKIINFSQEKKIENTVGARYKTTQRPHEKIVLIESVVL